jgi:pilus assembly protein CpaC
MILHYPHPVSSRPAHLRRLAISRSLTLAGILAIGVFPQQPAASQTGATSSKALADAEKKASKLAVESASADDLLAVTVGHSVILASTATPSAAASSKALAEAEKKASTLAVESASATALLHITLGRSVVLTSATPLSRIYVGNPAVLQSYTSNSTEVVLTAKAAGVSSLVIWDEAGGHHLYTVCADLDPAALRISLEQAFPGSSIRAETGEGKIFLTGSVATEAASEAALKMASLYAKDVVNSLRVAPLHDKQVQLKLRVVEVDRTRLDQLGINIFAGGRTAVATTTGQFASTAVTSNSSLSVSDPLNIFLYNAKLNLGLTIQDLEQKQVLQVLAEPTLTTLSGLPARFLSGGEFPFPVVQGGGAGTAATVSIQFRPYGVKVEFTPTVNPDGSIHLKLAPEVSTLDYSNAVTISGFTIPALSTRRVETEVEILDGQSFVVSGLLDHRTTEIMSKVPGIGNIPVLGQLFQSKNFNHSVVELVIIVTAAVVDPLSSNPEPNANEPKLVVPNLDADTFDEWMRAKPPAVEPATATQPAPQSPPEQQ